MRRGEKCKVIIPPWLGYGRDYESCNDGTMNFHMNSADIEEFEDVDNQRPMGELFKKSRPVFLRNAIEADEEKYLIK